MPPKILVPETSAKDHSATLPQISANPVHKLSTNSSENTWLYLVSYGKAYERVKFGAKENVKCRGIEVVLSMITIKCVPIETIKCV